MMERMLKGLNKAYDEIGRSIRKHYDVRFDGLWIAVLEDTCRVLDATDVPSDVWAVLDAHRERFENLRERERELFKYSLGRWRGLELCHDLYMHHSDVEHSLLAGFEVAPSVNDWQLEALCEHAALRAKGYHCLRRDMRRHIDESNIIHADAKAKLRLRQFDVFDQLTQSWRLRMAAMFIADTAEVHH